MIGGIFGRGCYSDEPYIYDQVGHRDIFAWRKTAKRFTLAGGHAVVIVGAKKINKSEFVYFIDPMDSSDPNDKSKQKIYMITYKNLRDNISNRFETQDVKFDHFGFAEYGNFELNNPKIANDGQLESGVPH